MTLFFPFIPILLIPFLSAVLYLCQKLRMGLLEFLKQPVDLAILTGEDCFQLICALSIAHSIHSDYEIITFLFRILDPLENFLPFDVTNGI